MIRHRGVKAENMAYHSENTDIRIFRILQGEATPEELADFAEWLKIPENEIYFNQLKELWNLTSGPRLSPAQLKAGEKRFRRSLRMRMGGG